MGIAQKANPMDVESGLGDGAFCGEVSVQRTSDITGDERCKVRYTCKLTLLEAKMAFFNSQKFEEMQAGDASDSDVSAVLDFDEFIECLARCGEEKFGELKEVMTLAQSVEGFIQNVLAEKNEEQVIADTV